MPDFEAAAVLSRYADLFSRPAADVGEDLESYCEALRRWQKVQNLVSRETLPTMWSRHIADSLQILRLLRPDDVWFLDLGSGGGLPAIPLAIARKGDAKTRSVLVEANGRKASFLRSVARQLGLSIEVLSARIEEIDSRETILPQVITSRALAPLSALCAMSAPFFGPETRAIFHKGREYGEELVETQARWDYEVVVVQSDTNADGVLLELRNLRSRTGA